jgi:serine O-acetyltransferase
MLRTLRADLSCHVDASQHSGLRFWVKAIGKAIIQPQIHVVLLYRLSHWLYRFRLLRIFAFMLRSKAVRIGSAEIHPAAKIGPGFALVHSIGTLIGPGVVIGKDARIAHIVSIGEQGRGVQGEQGAPRLGDHVTVGIGTVIMGNVNIGDHAVVGANSVVRKDVPAGAVVAGAPARIIRWVEGFEPQEATGP